MKRNTIIVLICCILTTLGFAGEVVALGLKCQDGATKPLRIPKTDCAIILDGQLNEDFWDTALTLPLKYEVSPGENTPAPVRTEVLLIYTETSIYIGFRCHDPEPKAIRARLSDRDHDPGDDYVGIVLDTFNDERRSYALWSNPLGVQEDAILTNEDYDTNWDTLYETKGHIADWGWSLEMKVPFRSIAFQRAEGVQVWGFDAIRNYPRSNFVQIRYCPIERGNNCELCRKAKIEGFEGVRPGRDLELNPTVTYVKTDARSDFPSGHFETTKNEAEFGFTGQWGVTPSINLAATLNPDFSQVEADAWQLDINENFALSYNEKRPFFTESADLFKTELDAVYTRSIRDPSLGFKISGKEGENSFGGFIVRDEVTNLIFPGSQNSRGSSLNDQAWSSVFRYKRDVGEKYTLGALFTGREGSEYHNRVFGLDGEFKFTTKDKISTQLLYSNTGYPREIATRFGQPPNAFSGKAFKLFYYHGSRSYSLLARYEDIDATFRADLGFIPKVDFRHYQIGADYRIWNTSKGLWEVFLLGGGYHHYENQVGNPLKKEAYGFLLFRGAMHSGVNLMSYKTREFYNGREFNLTEGVLETWIFPSSKYSLMLFSRFGGRIDYAHARSGRRLRINPSIALTPGSRFSLAADHTFERMSVDDGRLYSANVTQLTAKYQMSTKAFIRAIAQYVDYDYNAGLYAFPLDPKYRHLFCQLLFSYKMNPRTVFFFGYTDNYFGNQDYPLTQQNRTFFIKIGYAWQL